MKNELVNMNDSNSLENTKKPQTESVKPEKKKISNKLIIIIVIIILLLLGAGFYYYYQNYATGTLEIISETPGIDITINENEYNNINTLKMKLKSGIYTIKINKMDYLPIELSATVQKMRKKFFLVKLIKGESVLGSNNMFDNPSLISISGDDNIYYLDIDKKKIFKCPINSPTQDMVDLNIADKFDIENIIWVKDNHNNIIATTIEYYDQNNSEKNKKIIYIDLLNRSTLSLDPKIYNISYNRSGTRMAYVYDSNNQKQLVISDPTGKNWNVLFDSTNNISNILWLNDSQISFVLEHDNQSTTEVIDINNKNVDSIITKDTDSFFLNFQWTIDSNYLFFTTFENNYQRNYLINKNDKQLQELNNINTNWKLIKWQNNNILIYAQRAENEKENAEFPSFTINKYNVDTKNNTIIYNFSYNTFSNVSELSITEKNLYLITNDQIIRIPTS